MSHPPVVLADLRLKVVTPLFGGGVVPAYLDEDNLIRPSAIRGHLRFWWRACNAAAFPTTEDLHRYERALWGSAAKKDDRTHGPGAIGIQITEIVPGVQFTHQSKDLPNGKKRWMWRQVGDATENALGPDYALFPFTYQRESQRPALPGMVGIGFRLTLTVQPHAGQQGWPDEQKCVHAAKQALWAWITFGGVGSRTRRGCGTLYCTGDGPDHPAIAARAFQPGNDAQSVVTWVGNGLKSNVQVANAARSPLDRVPSLAGGRVLVAANLSAPTPAWTSAIGALKDFVSELGKDARRAELGLPRPNTGIGSDTRMASPLVLKGLATSERECHALALLLHAPFARNAADAAVRNDFMDSLVRRRWQEVP